MDKAEQQNIVGRKGPTPNLIAWKPMDGQFPMEHMVTGNRVGGIVALVIGMPWFYFAGEYLFDRVRQTGFSTGQAFLMLLVLGGLFVMLAGFSQFVYSEKTIIDGRTVSCQRSGLTGGRGWQELIINYRGVLKEYQYWDGDNRKGNYMIYTLVLDHDDSAKQVRLYESQNTMMYPPAEWDRLWKRYGELFQLPVMEKTPEGVISSSVEDIDKLLVEKITEKKVAVPDIDLKNPSLPSCLKLHKEDDLWVVTLRPVRQIRDLIALFVMIVVLVLLGMVFQKYTQNTFSVLLMWGFAGVLMFAGLFSMVSLSRIHSHPDQVAVDDKKVWYRKWNRRTVKWDTHDIPISKLCRIRLEERPTMQYRGERVAVEAKLTKLEFGQYLTARGRRILRDLLLCLIHRQKTGK